MAAFIPDRDMSLYSRVMPFPDTPNSIILALNQVTVARTAYSSVRTVRRAKEESLRRRVCSVRVPRLSAERDPQNETPGFAKLKCSVSRQSCKR